MNRPATSWGLSVGKWRITLGGKHVWRSLHKKSKKKKTKFIRLIWKKSPKEPFPADFIGRDKWDLLIFLKEIEGHQSFKTHIEAKFNYFMMGIFGFKNSDISTEWIPRDRSVFWFLKKNNNCLDLAITSCLHC